MILTEEEAKTKGCQEAIGKVTAQGGIFFPKCIGSACMAWRTQESFRADKNSYVHGGYCGKAGKP